MRISDQSHLWESILNEETFKNIGLDTFKEDGANSRITQYSPKTHGILFLKNIIFLMAKSFDANEIELLKKVRNRNVGGGIFIDFQGINLDLDYLLALDEVLFLRNQLNKTLSILEIGAGYGRTCHTILSLFEDIKEYVIVDFPKMLDLSSAYLHSVCTPEKYNKIKFIPVGALEDKDFDLIINIDSMQEMNFDSAKEYLKYINNFGKAFYTKNTVGKFEPKLCGWESSLASDLATGAGLMTQKLNIFCPGELKLAQHEFLLKFIPGNSWSVDKHSDAKPWSHYYQVLYTRNA